MSNLEPQREQQFPIQGRFIPMIIHEIRNPLSAINAANQVLDDTANDPYCDAEFRGMLTKIISRNIKRIENLIIELQDISPADLVNFERIGLCDVINHAVKATEDRLFLNGVNVMIDSCPETFIQGNAEKLSLAFQNIFVNAIEAMDGDERDIRIRIANDHDKNFTVEIRDNGRGMSREQCESIFQPTPSNKHAGKARGLSYIKDILTLHGATITMQSTVSEGTSFTILFPGEAQ